MDPDRWLTSIHRQAFVRTVQPNGSVVVEHHHYYLKQGLAGRKVALVVNAPERRFDVLCWVGKWSNPSLSRA